MSDPTVPTGAFDIPGISDEAFIHHCYVSAFRRPCHLHEAMSALALLASGRTRESLRQEITASGTRWRVDPTTALQSRMAMLLRRDGREFIRGAYRMALQREADPEGLRHHLALLNSGRSKQDLMRNIIDSDEARALSSAPMLRAAFAALVTPEALPRKPLSVADLRALREVERRGFVEQAYRVILGRNPDPDGRRHYESRLAHGRTRGRVIAELSRSLEAQQRPRTLAATLMLRMLRHL